MALTEERVIEMIRAEIGKTESALGKYLEDGKVQLGEVQRYVEAHQLEILDQQKRIDTMVDGLNEKFKEFSALISTRATETADLDARLKKLTEDIDGFAGRSVSAINEVKDAVLVVKTDATNEFHILKTNLETWATGLRLELGSGGSNTRAEYGSSSSKLPGVVDKKEVAVWKLADSVTKAEFRHWIDAMDIQLDAVHHFKYPEVLLDKVRRQEHEITPEVFKRCLILAMIDVDKMNGAPPIAVEAYESGNVDHWNQKATNLFTTWDFVEKSRFMFTYF